MAAVFQPPIDITTLSGTPAARRAFAAERRRSCTNNQEIPAGNQSSSNSEHELRGRLRSFAPVKVCRAMDLSKKSTWAEVIATGMVRRAIHDVAAAREIREVTEGRVPAALNLEGKIHYSAGQTAKQQLMKMLAEPER